MRTCICMYVCIYAREGVAYTAFLYLIRVVFKRLVRCKSQVPKWCNRCLWTCLWQVNLCVYIYIYTHVISLSLYTYTYVYIYIYIHIDVWIHQQCIYIYIYVSMHVYMYMYIHTVYLCFREWIESFHIQFSSELHACARVTYAHSAKHQISTCQILRNVT